MIGSFAITGIRGVSAYRSLLLCGSCCSAHPRSLLLRLGARSKTLALLKKIKNIYLDVTPQLGSSALSTTDGDQLWQISFTTQVENRLSPEVYVSQSNIWLALSKPPLPASESSSGGGGQLSLSLVNTNRLAKAVELPRSEWKSWLYTVSFLL